MGEQPEITTGLALPCYWDELQREVDQVVKQFMAEHGDMPKRVLLDHALVQGKRHIIISVRGQP